MIDINTHVFERFLTKFKLGSSEIILYSKHSVTMNYKNAGLRRRPVSVSMSK